MTAKINIITKCLAMIIDKSQCSDDYEVATYALNRIMPDSEREVLGQLVKHGPVWDGDIISKSARDNLLTWGLASRACFKGEQGYTVANYRGWDVLKAAS